MKRLPTLVADITGANDAASDAVGGPQDAAWLSSAMPFDGQGGAPAATGGEGMVGDQTVHSDLGAATDGGAALANLFASSPSSLAAPAEPLRSKTWTAATSAAMTADGSELHRHRAFYGRRNGHKLRPRQARLIETLLPRLAIDLSHPPPAELHTLFPVPVTQVRLEIGFGGGESMIAQAREQPLTGFLGVEPFVNGMAKALAGIESGDLPNIRLHFADAVSLIAWLPEASVACVDLIHPDPWPKRRHWKRRFVQDETVSRLARILRPGGEFRFVTDVADYAAWTLLRLLRSAAFEWTAQCADDWRKAWPGFTLTRYHARAARKQHASCFLVFRKL